MRQGRIISIEGGDGSGKSVMIERMQAFFKQAGIPHIITREPGGVDISEAIREILLHPGNTAMDSRTEALLFAAARRQHLVEKVLPAIESGKTVIFDRYVDSSMVYQGHVRGIGMEEVYELNLFATEGLLPGLTLVLDVDPEIGRKRILDNQREVDRLDKEALDFHYKVREGYLILAEKDPDRVRVIDANRTIEEVFEDLLLEVRKFLEV